jgi:hypothetical protein
MILLVLLGLALLIAVIAWGIYKTGFRATKMTVKTGLLEAEMERAPGDPTAATQPAPPPPAGPKVRQRAGDGGAITASGISAPADSAADIDQQAKGEGSQIDDSPINLT